MRALFRLRFIFPLIALVLIVSMQIARARRVQQLSSLPEWSVDSPTPKPGSITGYADGRRSLIVPDASGQSQQWIAQTQQLLERGTWRIEHVDYDNAPFGRETRLPGIYRHWLALLSRIYVGLTSSSPGIAVEQVALFADPLLQILIALGTGWFVSRHFGSIAGILIIVALVTAYPIAANFIPGAPNPQGLQEACVLWSVLPIAAGFRLRQTDRPASESHALLFWAGAAGGIGLCLNLNTQLSIIAGTFTGAVAYIALTRNQPGVSSPPWRSWALGGCLVSLIGYVLDYFPSRMVLRLDVNHPVYAISWLAAGELLQSLSEWKKTNVRGPGLRGMIVIVSTLIVMGTTGFIWVSHRDAILSSDITTAQLSRLVEGLNGASFIQLIRSEGISLRVCAMLLPLALVLALCVPFLRRNVAAQPRAAIAFLLGPIAITFFFACVMLRWWNTVESVSLVALVVVVAVTARAKSFSWVHWTAITGVGAVAWLGLIQLVPPASALKKDEFSAAEMQQVMERDLAHWLSQRHPGAVVLAPANLTTSLWFHGGLRGITTIDVDNNAGLGGALRIGAALTQQEALVLLQNRQASYIVLPSWDLGLDQSARIAAGGEKSMFIEQLRDWILPFWIRPVAYFSPAISGFESKSVVVLEIVEPQSEPILISQLATYFIEAGLPGHASGLRKFVRRFPTNLSALVSMAEIEFAREDQAAFSRALLPVVAALDGNAGRTLAWDRRIALAVVLAEGNRDDLAQPQISRCFEQVDEGHLRFLSPRSLFRFLALGKNYGLTIADPRLRQLALQLLPPESRQSLQ